MTRFTSPALNQPDLHLSPVALRSLLALAAIVFTAALWMALGAQAGTFGDDATPRFELEPVVVSARRALPEHQAMASVTGADCGNTRAASSANRVTLQQ